MAVTRDGVPIRCWTFPGNTADTGIIRRVRDDLAGWNLHRMVWVADRGFASAANRAYLTRGGGHYIHAEKLRHTNTEAAAALARAGRYHSVAGNLRVKEVQVAPGGHGDGDEGARAVRFVVCHNPDQAQRDAAVRANLIAHLRELIDGSDTWTPRRRDELVGSLKAKPGLRRYLRRTRAGLLRIDAAAAAREAHLDGKWLLRTSDATLTAEDLADAYKQLIAVEAGWRDLKSGLGLRPVHHRREDRIRGHVQLCWLALLLTRVIENNTGDTLAHHPPRTGPDAPGHPGHRRRRRRPTQPDHPRPAHPPERPAAARAAPLLRLHPRHRPHRQRPGLTSRRGPTPGRTDGL